MTHRFEDLSPRLVALGALVVVLLIPPFLSLFDRPRLVLGVPVLWFYLFAVWVVAVLMVGLTVRRFDRAGG